MNKLKLFICSFLLALPFRLLSGEGMWIPMLIGHLTIKDMQQQGLRLTAEDIYSATCLTEAIVLFGRG